MAERYSKDFETPEEAVRVIGTAIYQNEQIIKSASPSSAQFKKAKAALEKLRVELKKASDAVDTKRAEAKKPKVNVADAKDQYEREVALGKEPTARYGADGTSLVPGTEAYFKGTTDKPKAPAAPAAPTTPTGDSYTGSGTKDKPLELNGAPFSGTYKGKKYENGILVVEPTKTPSGKGTGTGDGDGKDKEDKTKWVSYLRLVFNTVEDKKQKAQIDKLFDDALKFGWSEETFMENLKGTQWLQVSVSLFWKAKTLVTLEPLLKKSRTIWIPLLQRLKRLELHLVQLTHKQAKLLTIASLLKALL
jgi:hypothetical protein